MHMQPARAIDSRLFRVRYNPVTMTKAFAAVFACTGAILASIGIGWAYHGAETSSLLAVAGLLLVSAGIVVGVPGKER